MELPKKQLDRKKSKSVVISQGTIDLSLPFRRVRGDYERSAPASRVTLVDAGGLVAYPTKGRSHTCLRTNIRVWIVGKKRYSPCV